MRPYMIFLQWLSTAQVGCKKRKNQRYLDKFILGNCLGNPRFLDRFNGRSVGITKLGGEEVKTGGTLGKE